MKPVTLAKSITRYRLVLASTSRAESWGLARPRGNGVSLASVVSVFPDGSASVAFHVTVGCHGKPRKFTNADRAFASFNLLAGWRS